MMLRNFTISRGGIASFKTSIFTTLYATEGTLQVQDFKEPRLNGMEKDPSTNRIVKLLACLHRSIRPPSLHLLTITALTLIFAMVLPPFLH